MKILLLLLLFSTSNFADELSTKYDEAFIQEALSDLPKLTKENARWLLPYDEWNWMEEYGMKGKFFSFKIKGQNPRVYETKDMTSEPFFVWSFTIKKNSGFQCGTNGALQIYELPKYIECGYMYCREKKASNPYNLSKDKIILERIRIYSPLDRKFVKMVNDKYTSEPCPYRFHVVAGREWDVENQQETVNYFRYTGFDTKMNYIEVEEQVSKKKMYLDIRGCKDKPELCKFVDFKFSELEKQWLALKMHQRKRDFKPLNDLIEHLLPCVKSKNFECIKKYVVSKEDYKEAESYFEESREAVHGNFDEELIEELKACLSYSNLLPHLKGSKGINKICIFSHLVYQNPPPKGTTKILSLTLPEGVRLDRHDNFKVQLRL